MADDFYPFVDSGDPVPDNEHLNPTASASMRNPAGGRAGEDTDHEAEQVRYATRIAVYDDMLSTPRVIVVDAKSVRAYLEEVTNTVYRCMKEQGGHLSLMVIREIVENFIHAHFVEPIISILDGGDTIRFADQGPGIGDKERAFEFGVTSADREQKRYIRGTGAGFPMVQQYLENAGGAVSIEDNMGQGTVVTVTVDAKRVVEVERAESRGAAVRGARPRYEAAGSGDTPMDRGFTVPSGQSVTRETARGEAEPPMVGSTASTAMWAPRTEATVTANPALMPNAEGGQALSEANGGGVAAEQPAPQTMAPAAAPEQQQTQTWGTLQQVPPGYPAYPTGSAAGYPAVPGYGYPMQQPYPLPQGYQPQQQYPQAYPAPQGYAPGYGQVAAYPTQQAYPAYAYPPSQMMGAPMVDDAGGEKRQSGPVVSERGKMAMAYLAEHASCGPTDLAAAFGSSNATWSRELETLSAQGLVVKQGQKRVLTDMGRIWLDSQASTR